MRCFRDRFGVNVYVNGGLLGCVREWSAFHVKGLEDARGKLRIRLVLVNPAGTCARYYMTALLLL